MQPNLSIVYNSFGGMGLLGMKWNLTGLSAITRCGQTPYYDNGNITAIQLTTQDRFTINGERLIIINGTYGTAGAQYATEAENFTRFFSYSDNHIKAFTDDGSIIEYGNTNDSKQKIGGTEKILSWYISKITDANGNYMTYHYGQSNGEILIDSIKYTGNTTAGIQPYAKVIFSYQNLPDHLGKNTCFVSGYGVPQTKLLQYITIYYGSTRVHLYQFNYNILQSGERTAHLKGICIKGKTSESQIGSTTITWGNNNSSLEHKEISGLSTGSTLFGDFNGDGYTDIVRYHVTAQGEGFKLYLYNPSTNSYPSNPTFNFPYYTFINLYAQDVNGDGKDELISIHQDIYPYSCNVQAIVFNDNSYSYIPWKNIPNFHSLDFGDFDGNGVTDILIKTSIENKKDITWTLYSWKWDVNNFVVMDTIAIMTTPLYSDLSHSIMDVNGNGKKDILVYGPNDLIGKVYEYNNLNSKFQSIFQNYPVGTVQNSFEYGDVNGDGITDIIVFFKENNLYKWKILMGKGNGTFEQHILNNALNTDYNGCPDVCPQNRVRLIDINGDGKQDIIQKISSNNKITINILFSNGWVNGAYKYNSGTIELAGQYDASILSFKLGDCNGDGKLDLFFYKYPNGAPPIIKVVYLNQDNDYESVKEIKDGIGKINQLNYKHQYFNTVLYPYGYLNKIFLSVAESLKSSNGLAEELNVLLYEYALPSYSIARRIFLGFTEFTCINYQDNTKDIYWFTHNAARQIKLPFRLRSFNNNQLINEKKYNIQIENLPPNLFAYNYYMTEEYNMLSKTASLTINELNDQGQLKKSTTQTYDNNNGESSLPTTWFHSEIQTYTYNTIILNGNQKKTVPTKILTTQQYEMGGLIVADTLTYNYSNAGRLNWMRKGNADGSITTTYGNYTTTGLYREKTVSATNLSRKEYYDYDNTNRFMTKTKNHLLHEATMSYDAKTGNKLSETDINGLTTTYKYGSLGQFKQINYPNGSETKDTMFWFTESNPPNARYCTTITATGSPTLTIYYDKLGREVCRLDDGYYYDTRYNEKGQVVKTSHPYAPLNTADSKKTWTTYTYDKFGRKETVIAPYTNLSYSYNNRKVTATDHLRHNITSYKDYDALGRIIQAKDSGGIINYAYAMITMSSKLRHQSIIETHGATTTIISDLWGNRLSIEEPNAGKITSTYNKFNELIKQKDARGNITTYQYDALGRITQKKFSDSEVIVKPKETVIAEPGRSLPNSITVDYTYDNFSSYNRGRGKIYQIMLNGSLEETYTYNNLSRLSQFEKIIDNTPYSFYYSYTPVGQLEVLTYPDDFAVAYSYSSTGKLDEIRKWDDNSLIYKVHSRNKFGQTTLCSYGNELATDYTYNDYGLLTRINSGNKLVKAGEIIKWEEHSRGFFNTADSTILNYRYAYDNKGLMSSRSESVVNRKELYSYDNLDRLTGITFGTIGQAGTPQTFSYHNNGNITQNTLVGEYNYLSSKPHAVTQIDPIDNNIISDNQCNVIYNFFNQPTQITEGDNKVELFYGSNQQRNKAEIDGNGHFARYYINKYYEVEQQFMRPMPPPRNHHYIYGDKGIVALHINDNYSLNNDSIYYIHTDHLGSYCALSNINKQVVARNYFDAWGNFIIRDNYFAVPVTTRGFTGHEHYPELKIINMNGRLYDPVIGRFFSPDQYVANSTFTQDFNRYSYARNNPLHYTDPTGQKLEWWKGLLITLGVDALFGGAITGALITTGVTCAPLTSDASYELQKSVSPIAIKFSFGFGSRNHIGIDASFGMLKSSGYRWHGGASYYFGNNPYSGGFNGTETRTGAELGIGIFNISGTKFKWDGNEQITNKLALGGHFASVAYENDYMFEMGKVLGRYNADGGDRWRTAAVGINIGPFNINLNMHTGDPDVDGVIGSRYDDENWLELPNGKKYYTGNTALDPSLRAGVLSFGFGPIRIGRNSEKIRHEFQNKFAHDFLMKGKSYWFLPLDIEPSWFFYFGTGSGNTLW